MNNCRAVRSYVIHASGFSHHGRGGEQAFGGLKQSLAAKAARTYSQEFKPQTATLAPKDVRGFGLDLA
jgi:hypothetical protein